MNDEQVWLEILTAAIRAKGERLTSGYDMDRCIDRADKGLEAYKERFDGEKIKGGTA